MAQHTSASNGITFLLCGSDEPTPEQDLADKLVCWLEPGLGVALALLDIDELCELPLKSTLFRLLGPYWTWDGVNE